MQLFSHPSHKDINIKCSFMKNSLFFKDFFTLFFELFTKCLKIHPQFLQFPLSHTKFCLSCPKEGLRTVSIGLAIVSCAWNICKLTCFTPFPNKNLREIVKCLIPYTISNRWNMLFLCTQTSILKY